MKKILVLPLIAMAALVSQAWAGICTGTGGATACQFDTGCYEMSSEYSGTSSCDAGSCTCDQIIKNCTDNGALYSGVTGWAEGNDYGKGWKCSDHGGTYQGGKLDPSKVVLGCCKWSTESNCYPIYSGQDTDGEDGADKVASCQTGTNKFWSGSGACPTSCPSGTPTYDGGSSPIKFNPASLALTVAQSGRSLHISSAKEATVSLYDMSGAKVYSGKVRAGNSVFSLEKVAVGSYYAVVQSGSDAKKVSVVLK